MTLEAESKFPVQDFSRIVSNLRKHGQCLSPWYFEQNQVFDTSGQDLRHKGMLLRLRKAGKTTLTLKRPADELADIPGIKQLEELQCHVDNAWILASILHALGYEKRLCYEKFRCKWKVAECTVCLDRLCFGTFVEIEGPGEDTEEGIFTVAALLGLDPETALSDNYHDLFQNYLVDKGLPPEDSFVFSPQERNTLCHKLGITDT